MRRLEFFHNVNGDCPIEDFFDSLNNKQMQKVAWTLTIIKDLGGIPEQYFKKLTGTDDFWEIRVRYSTDSIRFICFLYEDNLIVLTSGFIKKTERIPKKEIEIAEKRKKEYERRNK